MSIKASIDNQDKIMKAAGFTYDPTQTGHVRWTHFAKGITCLRQPYMTDVEWARHMELKITEANNCWE